MRLHNFNSFNSHTDLRGMLEDINQFHEKFEITYEGPPRTLPTDLDDFRSDFLQEEVDEYKVSSHNISSHVPEKECLAIQLDSLVDLVYVALGTAYLQGFNFQEAWNRVHAANMRKIRSPSQKESAARGSAFDVVKPKGWMPPDLSDLV